MPTDDYRSAEMLRGKVVRWKRGPLCSSRPPDIAAQKSAPKSLPADIRSTENEAPPRARIASRCGPTPANTRIHPLTLDRERRPPNPKFRLLPSSTARVV